MYKGCLILILLCDCIDPKLFIIRKYISIKISVMFRKRSVRFHYVQSEEDLYEQDIIQYRYQHQ